MAAVLNRFTILLDASFFTHWSYTIILSMLMKKSKMPFPVFHSHLNSHFYWYNGFPVSLRGQVLLVSFPFVVIQSSIICLSLPSCWLSLIFPWMAVLSISVEMNDRLETGR